MRTRRNLRASPGCAWRWPGETRVQPRAAVGLRVSPRSRCAPAHRGNEAWRLLRRCRGHAACPPKVGSRQFFSTFPEIYSAPATAPCVGADGGRAALARGRGGTSGRGGTWPSGLRASHGPGQSPASRSCAGAPWSGSQGDPERPRGAGRFQARSRGRVLARAPALRGVASKESGETTKPDARAATGASSGHWMQPQRCGATRVLSGARAGRSEKSYRHWKGGRPKRDPWLFGS